MDEYLALAAASQVKHEYLAGVIYAVPGQAARGMAGGSQVHARIIRNTGYALHGKLLGSPCEVLAGDMRLRIAAAGAVFYPHVLVHCQATDSPATTTELTDACVVVEVLSPTTQHFDRNAKLQAYQLCRVCSTSCCCPAWSRPLGFVIVMQAAPGLRCSPGRAARRCSYLRWAWRWAGMRFMQG